MAQRAQKAKHLRKFTEAMIAKLKAPREGKDRNGNPCGVTDYYDSLLPGLILRVNYGGSKIWRVRYYVKIEKNGKSRTEQRLRKLGRYPILKLQEARDKARPYLVDAHKAIREEDAAKEAGTFKEVAENFIKRHVNATKDRPELRSKPEIVRCLDKYIYPRWQTRLFTELRRSDVTTLLDQIEDEHGSRQADMCLAIISKMCNWYLSRNDDYVSPVVRGMGRAKKKNGGRDRVLDDGEIRALFTACTNMGTFGAIVKVLLLTGQRREKVATMKWDDVVDGEWKIAAEDREKSNAGTLRLPKMVLDIIEQQPRIANSPYVFAAGKGDGPFNSFSQRKAELDKKLPGMAPWVLHDLRRTARTRMVEAGVGDNVAERVLGHAISGVHGVYNRHAYVDEKADALSKLAALIERIVNPPADDNVVSMPTPARKKRRA
jgi:integrase